MNVQIDENAIYTAIANELESGTTDKGLWTRLFAECDGDEQKTKVAYIKHRAAVLIALEKSRIETARRELAAEVFFRRHPDWFIECVERHFKLPEYLLGKYRSRWNWKTLSTNSAFSWTEQLIERYKDDWDWQALSGNEKLPWSEKLIERYKDNWVWHDLSRNEKLPWSENLLCRFAEWWDFRAISSNPALPWTFKLIHEFCDKWDWLDWLELARNGSIPWNAEHMVSHEQFAGRHNDYWDALAQNPKVWSSALIERLREKLKYSWDELCANEAIPWTAQLIERFQPDISYGCPAGFASNSTFPWSVEFLDEIIRDNNESGAELPNFFELFETLSGNPALPWSIELIDAYKDEREAFEGSGYGVYGDGSRGHIYQAGWVQWDWSRLSANEGLPWSEELLQRYKSYWHLSRLARNSAARCPLLRDWILEDATRIRRDLRELDDNEDHINYSVTHESFVMSWDYGYFVYPWCESDIGKIPEFLLKGLRLKGLRAPLWIEDILCQPGAESSPSWNGGSCFNMTNNQVVALIDELLGA